MTLPGAQSNIVVLIGTIASNNGYAVDIRIEEENQMVTVVFSWLVIGTLALIFGKAIVDRIYHNDLDTMGKMDIWLMAGIIFLNGYAQIFSLFYKVSMAACLILFAAAAVLVCRDLFIWIRERKCPLDLGFFKEHPYRLALILAGGGVAAH